MCYCKIDSELNSEKKTAVIINHSPCKIFKKSSLLIFALMFFVIMQKITRMQIFRCIYCTIFFTYGPLILLYDMKIIFIYNTKYSLIEIKIFPIRNIHSASFLKGPIQQKKRAKDALGL